MALELHVHEKAHSSTPLQRSTTFTNPWKAAFPRQLLCGSPSKQVSWRVRVVLLCVRMSRKPHRIHARQQYPFTHLGDQLYPPLVQCPKPSRRLGREEEREEKNAFPRREAAYSAQVASWF